MSVSYHLSAQEGRIGGPEKPLSELGRRGYLRFWQARIAREVLATKKKTWTSVEELAKTCWMETGDCLMTLKEMESVCERRKDGSVAVSQKRLRDWVQKNRISLDDPIDEEGFLEVEEIEDGGSKVGIKEVPDSEGLSD